ncbi:hypothetical protein BESB_077340 [Besnoitia besnoiti]|uniref:Transcription factor btf3 n=1 Tax=Besnoitia besnoiti TaxID=94643 RepID=A0A2A9MD36_BESBE|nr:hypothetical protein BESB_077340 [Besnoitia besnoiti]PFH33517.1 hypothetical protein BESB_077340 [Besnoitia besnoiti]
MQGASAAEEAGDPLFAISAESVERIDDLVSGNQTLSAADAGGSMRFASCFSGRQTVGCYSWIARDDEHTVAAPGLPPVFCESASVSKGGSLRGKVIRKGSKLEFYDENAFHDPDHPMEQLLCSLDACQTRWLSRCEGVALPCPCTHVLGPRRQRANRLAAPTQPEGQEPNSGFRGPQAVTSAAEVRVQATNTRGLCLSQFDFITDRTNLRVFLRFLFPGLTRYSREASIDLDVYGSVCVLTRVCAETRGPDVGYGHSFEHCCCDRQTISFGEENAVEDDTYEILDLSSFHLIQSFTLCDAVRLLVRTEVDACMHPAALSSPRDSGKCPENRFFGRCGAAVPNPEYTPLAQQGPTQYLCRQEPIGLTPFERALLNRDERLLMELKSVSDRYVSAIPWIDIYFQMRIGDVHSLVVASHSWGKIGKVEKLTLSSAAERAFGQTPCLKEGVAMPGTEEITSQDVKNPDDPTMSKGKQVEPDCAGEVVYWSRLASLLLRLKMLALQHRDQRGVALLKVELTADSSTFCVYRRKGSRPRLSADIVSRIMACSENGKA